MAIIFVVCSVVALLGMVLLTLSWVHLRRIEYRSHFVESMIPFLPGSGTLAVGVLLTVLGGGGDYAAYRFGNGFTPRYGVTGENRMTITGTIEMTKNWALLDVDPGQKLNGQLIQGPVILMMQSGGQNPTDQANINAAFQCFDKQAGVHYILAGIWSPTAARQFFFVQQAYKS
jgi:hypothetical protein